MTRFELMQAIAGQHPQLDAKKVELLVKQLFHKMSSSLLMGERIEIRDFGSFSLRFRQARLRRNPKTGKPVQTESKYIPHFKPGKQLKERVNKPEPLSAGPKPKPQAHPQPLPLLEEA